MYQQEYNSFYNKALCFKFNCVQCGEEIYTDSIRIPIPNIYAESNSESYSDNNDIVVCPNCQKEYNISVWASFTDGYFTIEELDEGANVEVEEIPLPGIEDYIDQFDAISDNKQFYSKFKADIDNLKKINSLVSEDTLVVKLLKKQIFVGIITALETFLSDTFFNLTINNKFYFKRFVESHPEFKARKVSLLEFFKEKEYLKNTAKSIMVETIYHQLHKVKKMYEKTFNIQFPEIETLMKQISIRHDLVHRSGKSKDGTLVDIDSSDIERVIELTEEFVKDIATKLHLNEPKFPEL